MKRVIMLSIAAAIVCGTDPAARAVVASAGDQKPALSEKEARTPAQQKISSQLLNEIYRRRGQAKAKQVPAGPTGVRLDGKGRALVDVRADVVPDLESKLRKLGSTIVSTSRPYRSIVAWIPVLKLEDVAAEPSVRAIEPAPESTTHK